ncbi:hypothetical protein FIBSPDRAFT_851541 [Athelia psychrophila]|uniref:Uncharacterized protein n=1 Tax=Athelia psychrophila TaxID=1759441 RepID=A0A166SLN8_9AGAM|nr:hypothetical protein FIBSPDRAFT_851541 [Fibularhizoctonia sp. CBS 109695]
MGRNPLERRAAVDAEDTNKDALDGQYNKIIADIGEKIEQIKDTNKLKQIRDTDKLKQINNTDNLLVDLLALASDGASMMMALAVLGRASAKRLLGQARTATKNRSFRGLIHTASRQI